MTTDRINALFHSVGLLGAGGLIAVGLFLSKPDTQTQPIKVPTDPPDRIVEVWVPKAVQLVAVREGQLLKSCSQLGNWITTSYAGVVTNDTASTTVRSLVDSEWATVPCVYPK